MPKLTFTFPDHSQMKYALYLERTHTTLGRGTDNKVPLEHSSVSSHHACIDRVTGGFVLVDLHSTNGVRENNIKLSHMQLKPGKVYKIGDVVMQCQFSEEEFAEFAKETNDLSFTPHSEIISG